MNTQEKTPGNQRKYVKAILPAGHIARFWRKHLQWIFGISLAVGIISMVLTIALGVAKAPTGFTNAGFILTGIFEIVFLAASRSFPQVEKDLNEKLLLRKHIGMSLLIAIFLIVLILVVPSKKGIVDGATVWVGHAFVVFLLVAAVTFAVMIVLAVANSSDQDLVGGYRRFRLELYYVYVGAISLGLGIAALIKGNGGAWNYVILVFFGVVIATCVWIMTRWRQLGGARSEGGKFLVRQSSLTSLLCLAIVVSDFDKRSSSALLAIATAASVMLVPTLAEFLSAVLRSKRSV